MNQSLEAPIGRKRTDEEERRLLLASKASGKGCNRFAAEMVAANSRREWRDAGLLQPAFVPLRVAPEVSDSRPLVLQLAGAGHRVEVHQDFDAITLRRLVDAPC